jgi:uncharacterized membrane protein
MVIITGEFDHRMSAKKRCDGIGKGVFTRSRITCYTNNKRLTTQSKKIIATNCLAPDSHG